MKKIITGILLIVFFCMFVNGNEVKDKKFFLSLKWNFLSASDENYKNIYGSNIVYPGVEIGFKVFKDIYFLAGYEKITKEGIIPELNETVNSTQNIIFFGLGYWGSFSENFGYRAELGGISFSYKEEALGVVVDGSKSGIFLNGGLVYNFGKRFFASFLIGFKRASENIEEVDVKFGGFKSSIGIGVKL